MTERVRLFMPHIKTKRDLAEVNNNNNNNSNINKAKCSDAHRLLRRGSRGRVTTGGDAAIVDWVDVWLPGATGSTSQRGVLATSWSLNGVCQYVQGLIKERKNRAQC